jgi:hypothetical protein
MQCQELCFPSVVEDALSLFDPQTLHNLAHELQIIDSKYCEIPVKNTFYNTLNLSTLLLVSLVFCTSPTLHLG